MKELRKKYMKAKRQAMKLMQDGNITEYVAHLVMVQDLRLQLLNTAVTQPRR